MKLWDKDPLKLGASSQSKTSHRYPKFQRDKDQCLLKTSFTMAYESIIGVNLQKCSLLRLFSVVII